MSTSPIPYELIERYDRPGPRYTSYPTVPVWTTGFGSDDYVRALGSVGANDTLALYVHLPFCAVKCLYCGCNMTVTRRADTIDNYLTLLERESEMVVQALGGRRRVTQMHWGGGTPNYLTEEQLWRAFEIYSQRFDIAEDAELSIEADPRQTSRSQLVALRSMGFNRISFGVQDVDRDVQEVIGRVQSLALVKDACEMARAAGFYGLNVDVMYGLPLQTPERYARTLESVIELDPDRIACFGYAHVPWMRSHQRAIDESLLPNAAERFTLFRQAVDAFEGSGYQWIGLDHFARTHDALSEAQREHRLHRNFMGYTVMPADHLVAFGMSAISEVSNAFAQNVAKIADWQSCIEASRFPVIRGHTLTAEDIVRRDAIMQLMCNLELRLDRRGTFADEVARLRPLEEDGLVQIDVDRLTVTPAGRFFLRNICMVFDAYLPAESAEERRFSRAI